MTEPTTQASPETDPFPQAVSDRICKHMNEDHADAVLLYAQAFGGLKEATVARMKAIDAAGMDLQATVDSTEQSLRIPFDPPLANAKAAHETLVAMMKEAQQQTSS